MNQTLNLMRTYCKTLIIISFFFLGLNGIQAQTTQVQLNQVALIKQFIGKWKCELGKDTILITDNTPFGTGMLTSSGIATKDAIIDSVKQLYGYDKKTDKFIIAELIKSSPSIEICNFWFTSENAGKIIVTNPDNAPFMFNFEFKTTDMIVQTALVGGKVVKEITLTRIKSDKN
jgi:hypothetical protein